MTYTALLVGGFGSSNVLRYDQTTGEFLDEFVPAGSGGLNHTGDIVFGPDNNFYVGSTSKDYIRRYDGTTGEFLDIFIPAGSGGLRDPRSLLFVTRA